VLVSGATVPAPADLTDDLQGLRFRQAVVLHDATWVRDDLFQTRTSTGRSRGQASFSGSGRQAVRHVEHQPPMSTRPGESEHPERQPCPAAHPERGHALEGAGLDHRPQRREPRHRRNRLPDADPQRLRRVAHHELDSRPAPGRYHRTRPVRGHLLDVLGAVPTDRPVNVDHDPIPAHIPADPHRIDLAPVPIAATTSGVLSPSRKNGSTSRMAPVEGT
jgi:hypothetical protein